jgi:stearoyl-CoA desaturase (delta-9 desaturase)
MEPEAHPRQHLLASALVVTLPLLLFGLVVWQVAHLAVRWHDLVVFAVVYVPTGFGITVGYHRFLTHRSFKAGRGTRFVLTALGAMALEGPPISWVADHRKHHAFSDQEGDPHSPHVDHDAQPWRGAWRGLVHAHVGWLFLHGQRGKKERYAPDLLADPVVRFVDRTTLWWTLGGLLLPFLLGLALSGSLMGGFTGFLWGGVVRVLLMHHATYSINSLCHYFGRQPFRTEDESRNLAWLSLFTFGEAWHNNHHAFPTSAAHGLKASQLDPSALLIRALERLGLVWDVVRVSPARQASKAAGASSADPAED